MFRWPWLDRLSRVHPMVPPLIFVPAIAVLGVSGARGLGAGSFLIACLSGYVFWTFCEYWIHRVVFHFEPHEGIGARLHWMVHGVHHDHPNDPLRLVMPPAVSVPLAALFIGLFVPCRLPALRHAALRPASPSAPAHRARASLARITHAPPLRR
jgi:dihydroceramide fatty acyl 2-hydroxylase